MEMIFELLAAVVVIPFDGGLLEGAVHSLDLPIRQRVPDLSQPVLNGELPTNTLEEVFHGIFVLFVVGKLNPVVRQDDTDGVRQALPEMA
jgi:hypothetical protein